MTLTFELLTLKVVSESHVTWATSVPILVFLGLSVLELGPMYVTDKRQTKASNNGPAYCFLTTTNWLAVAMQTSVKEKVTPAIVSQSFYTGCRIEGATAVELCEHFKAVLDLLCTSYYRESGFLFSHAAYLYCCACSEWSRGLNAV